MLTLREARTNRPDEYSCLSPGRGTVGLGRARPGRPDRHPPEAGHGRHQHPGHGQQRPDRPNGHRANAGLAVDRAAVGRLNRALGPALLQPRFDACGGWRLDPGASGFDGALARLAAIVVDAMGDGAWARLKPCRNHGCRWVFYDHSTNRSGTWCTMSVCGNRLKARAWRQRRRP